MKFVHNKYIEISHNKLSSSLFTIHQDYAYKLEEQIILPSVKQIFTKQKQRKKCELKCHLIHTVSSDAKNINKFEILKLLFIIISVRRRMF